jgi:hypothetical protein
MANSKDPFIELVDWLDTPVSKEGLSLPLLGLCYYFQIPCWLELFYLYYLQDREFIALAGDEVLIEIADLAHAKGLYQDRFMRILKVYYLHKIDISDVFSDTNTY